MSAVTVSVRASTATGPQVAHILTRNMDLAVANAILTYDIGCLNVIRHVRGIQLVGVGDRTARLDI